MNAHTLPADDVFAALLALATGEGMLLSPSTGRMAVELGDGDAAFITGNQLDALFERSWITADDESRLVTITEAGAYHLRRWVEREARKRKQRKPMNPFQRRMH